MDRKIAAVPDPCHDPIRRERAQHRMHRRAFQASTTPSRSWRSGRDMTARRSRPQG